MQNCKDGRKLQGEVGENVLYFNFNMAAAASKKTKRPQNAERAISVI